ncbi:MAG: hypothetical protein K2I49_00765 [Ureaplasma sp.]|nr:hypothetical protein [Ureaplasma sp.]
MKKLSNIQKNNVVAGFGIGALFGAMPAYLKTFFISSAANVGIGLLSNLLNISTSAVFASKTKSVSYNNYNQKEVELIKNTELKTPILNLS